MMSLIKIAELVIVFFVIRSFLKVILPTIRRKSPEKKPDEKPKRFNSSDHNISDADYDEL